MANGADSSQPDGTWPDAKSGPLIVGGSLALMIHAGGGLAWDRG
jgi:hypothetical protein